MQFQILHLKRFGYVECAFILKSVRQLSYLFFSHLVTMDLDPCGKQRDQHSQSSQVTSYDCLVTFFHQIPLCLFRTSHPQTVSSLRLCQLGFMNSDFIDC